MEGDKQGVVGEVGVEVQVEVSEGVKKQTDRFLSPWDTSPHSYDGLTKGGAPPWAEDEDHSPVAPCARVWVPLCFPELMLAPSWGRCASTCSLIP